MDFNDELDYNEYDIEKYCDNSNVILGENIQQKNKESNDSSRFNDSWLQLDCPEEKKELETEYKLSNTLVSNKKNNKDNRKNEKFNEQNTRKKEEPRHRRDSTGHTKNFRKRNKKRKRVRYREGKNRNSQIESRGFSHSTRPVPLLDLILPPPGPVQLSSNKYSSSGMFGLNSVLDYHRSLNEIRYTSLVNNSRNLDGDTRGSGFFHTTSTDGFVNQVSNSIPEAFEDRFGTVYQEPKILFQPFTFKPLEEDLKKRLVLQKEARLRRFKEDEAKRKKEILYSKNEKRSITDLNLDFDYFKKMEEQKLIREKILALKEELRERAKDHNDGYLVSVSPSLNKELLLLMKNPFDSISTSSNLLRESKVKQETESHLTGCIVKVLNISPSSTIYDIHDLCKPIGPVKEIKLNFPKENSVVIRFADPFAAEKFYNIYHGRKINNYFLNVIVV